MNAYVEITLTGLSYTVWSEEELNKRIEGAKKELRDNIRDAKKAYRKANGVPQKVRWGWVDKYLAARHMLLIEGASHGEVSRTVGVDRGFLRRYFPDTAWHPSGASSAFIRKGNKVIDNAHIK